MLRSLYVSDSKTSETTPPHFLILSASTGYSVELKYAAVLCVRDERHGSIVSGVA